MLFAKKTHAGVLTIIYLITLSVNLDISFAHAENLSTLRIAICIPELPLKSTDTFKYINELSHHLKVIMGKDIYGESFRNTTDIFRNIKGKKINFVILSGLNPAPTKESQLIASGSYINQKNSEWSLLSKEHSSISSHKGKRLQLPNLGDIASQLIQNGLFHGNIVIKEYFNLSISPDLISAIEAVYLGRAEVVFAPVGTRGLVPIVSTTVWIPAPQVWLLTKGLPESILTKLFTGLSSYKSELIPIKWSSPNPTQHKQLISLGLKRELRMALIPKSDNDTLSTINLINWDVIKMESIDIGDLFEIP